MAPDADAHLRADSRPEVVHLHGLVRELAAGPLQARLPRGQGRRSAWCRSTCYVPGCPPTPESLMFGDPQAPREGRRVPPDGPAELRRAAAGLTCAPDDCRSAECDRRGGGARRLGVGRTRARDRRDRDRPPAGGPRRRGHRRGSEAPARRAAPGGDRARRALGRSLGFAPLGTRSGAATSATSPPSTGRRTGSRYVCRVEVSRRTSGLTAEDASRARRARARASRGSIGGALWMEQRVPRLFRDPLRGHPDLRRLLALRRTGRATPCARTTRSTRRIPRTG